MLWAEANGSIVPLVAVLAAMLLLLATFWRMARRTGSRSEGPLAQPGKEPFHLWKKSSGSVSGGMRSSPADAPASLTAWEVHIQETAREVSAVVDTKLRLLQQLVAEADRAATRLERALSAAQTALPAQPTASPPTAASGPSSLPCQTESGPSDAVPPESSAIGPSLFRPEAVASEVGLLADYGFPVEEIASRCGLTVAEVEALLCQRPKGHPASRPPNHPESV